MIRDRVFQTRAMLSDDEAAALSRGPAATHHTIAVRPPRTGTVPATLTRFVTAIQELQSRWVLRNASPVIAYELRRPTPGTLQVQFVVPTKRLDRKVRTHLQNEIRDVGFAAGDTGLPVAGGDTVGGGILTVGRRDWYPLATDFEHPPMNAVVGALHRHAMQDTRFVIQLLFQPIAGHPLRRYVWTKGAYRRLGYLRKEKEYLWHERPATPRERRQADAIEDKAGSSRYRVSIRILVIGAGPHTQSRVKEIAGAFNLFERDDTGQYFNTVTVKGIRRTPLVRFCDAVRRRAFGGWSLWFRVTPAELAALVSIPNRAQQNIQYAAP